jgi:hypothetical protein
MADTGSAAVIVMMNALTTALNGGTIVLTTSGDVEVATCTLANPAYAGAAAVGSNVDADLATTATDAHATGGTPTKFYLKTSGAASRIEGTVGTSNAELIITASPVIADAQVDVTSLKLRMAFVNP